MKSLLGFSILFALSCAPKQQPVEIVQIAAAQSSLTVPQQVAHYLFNEGLHVDGCYGIMLDTKQGNVTIGYTPREKDKNIEDLFTLLYSPNEDSSAGSYFYFDYRIDGTLDYLVNEQGQPTSFDALDPVEQLQHATRYQQTLLDILAFAQQ